VARTRAVLGIDAAWTLHNPSGVALAVEAGTGWRLLAAEASYRRFLSRAHGGEPEARPTGSRPEPSALLAAAKKLAGVDVGLVAFDMPLSHEPITGRRASDRAVSSAYGRQKCATHAPSADRPGEISDALRAGFASLGYRLQTTDLVGRGIIEVYPHPALVELAGASVRLPYKASRARLYWPEASVAERKLKLIEQWRTIVALLDREVAGAADLLRPPQATASGVDLKAFEDMLDAAICAWIAACALDGRCRAYGDDVSAVWVPRIG
jgi:predicted RNase H-like nuclease